MALSRKRRGYRSLTVEGEVYLWRFSPGLNEGTVRVLLEASPQHPLELRLLDWHDPWFHMGLTLHGKLDNTPSSITPAFVSQAITCALERGWTPETHGTVFRLEFMGGGVLD